jgi:hypothetical protein
MRSPKWSIAPLSLLMVVVILLLSPWDGGQRAAARTDAPGFGSEFWKHWGDGKAELAGYDLVYPRYGAERRGTAVTIFVTETFSGSDRIKSESRRPDSDLYPVMKLNLMQDFPTGIYDYNLMTSTFVALEGVNGRPAGSVTKVAFSAQEWCGQVYAQLLFDRDEVRYSAHSYFDGEGDRDERLEYAPGGLSEDALLLWARGLAGPLLEAGQSVAVPLLRGLEGSRLAHVELDWRSVKLTRGAEPRRVRVPAGEFEVDVLSAEVEDGRVARLYPPGATPATESTRTWTFWVERSAPRRLIRWQRDDGLTAEMIASQRLAYWTLNGAGHEEALQKLGLTARPPRTP